VNESKIGGEQPLTTDFFLSTGGIGAAFDHQNLTETDQWLG
jgi:hypothetical protein